MKKTTRFISGAIALLFLLSTNVFAVPVSTYTSQGDLSNVVRTPFSGGGGDTTPPVITTCANTFSANVSSAATININASSLPPFNTLWQCVASGYASSATAIDAVDGVVTVANNAPLSITPVTTGTMVSTTIITFSASDAAGNLATKTLTVSIAYVLPLDTTPPVVTAPTGISVQEASAGSGVPATDAAIVAFLGSGYANDAVDGVVTTTATPLTGTLTVGVYTVTFTATDAAGNVGTATSTVTITAAPASGVGDGICTTATDDGSGNVAKGSSVSVSFPAGFTKVDIVACSPGGRGWDINTTPEYLNISSHHAKCVPGDTTCSNIYGSGYFNSGNKSTVNVPGYMTVYGGGSAYAGHKGFRGQCSTSGTGSGCKPGTVNAIIIPGNQGIGDVGGAPVCMSITGGPTVCSGAGGNSMAGLGLPGASGGCQSAFNLTAAQVGSSFSCHDYGTTSDNYSNTPDPYKGAHGNINWRFHN